MFIDALTLPEDTLVETDICIIGGGAAGITLAREFSNQPYQVCLLESGGLDYGEATQSLYTGENVGVNYFPLKEARARYFGGSTNLWAGWSRPLDDIDFEDRPWMPYSGWPFTKAELDPYYKRAQKACKLGPYEYDLAYWEEALGELQRRQLPFLTEQIATYLWQIIPPTHLHFGEAYRAELEQARNINTILSANVVEIETNDTAQAVTRLRVARLDGKQFWVAAKVFILAVGGIENPRLLLGSNQVQSNGLGNQYDLVGRFFMEHPYLISGKMRLSSPAPLYAGRSCQIGETFIATALGLSKEVQEREQMVNFCARLLPFEEEWIKAFQRLKRLKNRQPTGHQAFPTLKEQRRKYFPTIKEGRKYDSDPTFIQDLATTIANFDRIAAKAYAKLFSKKSLSAAQPNLCNTHLIGEQAPNPDSRITLSRERDSLGLNRVQLDWRLSPIDKYTIERSQQIIAEEFARSGLGQLQSELTEDDTSWQSVRGSYHHIGTTRMSINPKQGVVNEQCQVHGVSNLYVAGSSVFPTSGLSNPTLTIIALAVRLADHIKEHMDSSAGVTKGLEVTSTK
ncbi:GMC family oxidoreductase [Chroococcidiopsis sp. CCMEE 29]|uniref:FAD-dependent oxidoreductase n=1 Tax=Chroococcidiopsis sp. CCMEE 29 TaxID=155894 RepID=UPI002020A132|nr:GMC family oxidoreductase [Chroococcidiopsis sp. CCMEE 29]